MAAKSLDIAGWLPASLLAESDHDMDWAWAVMTCHPLLAKQVPPEARQETLQCGYSRWSGSNFVSAGELSRVFRKNLGICFVTGAFHVYRNALTFALSSYWGEDLTMAADFTLEPAASEAAYALLDLLEAGDDPPARPRGARRQRWQAAVRPRRTRRRRRPGGGSWT